MKMQVKADYGSDQIVAFLDVLGFKEILSNPAQVELYFNTIINELETLQNIDSKKELRYALISDSVVLSFPFNNDIKNLNEFLIALGRIQATLCLEDIWLRGAITIGKIKISNHGSSQVVFGDGLAKAYMLESSFAKYPRVILDPLVFKLLKKDRANLKSELNKLNAGSRIFCNVIYDPMDSDEDAGAILGTPVESDAVWVNYLENTLRDKYTLGTFTDLLRENLYSSQEHYTKYKWVQNYAMALLCKKPLTSIYGEEIADEHFYSISCL